MTATTSNNGRVIRKSLAEQIDRLDGILDCLADGLNDAVAAAVTEATALAVKEAVRGVLSEVLTNPDFLERIRSTIVPPSQGMQPVGPQAQGPTSKERLHRLGNQVKAQSTGCDTGAAARFIRSKAWPPGHWSDAGLFGISSVNF